MSASSRVVFYSLDRLLAWLLAEKIDDANPPLMATTAVSDCHLTSIISSTFPMPLLWKRQRIIGVAFPEVIVNRSSEMWNSRCTRFLCFHSTLVAFCYVLC